MGQGRERGTGRPHRRALAASLFAVSALLALVIPANASPPPWTTSTAVAEDWTEILEGPVTLQVMERERIEIYYQDAEVQRTFKLQISGPTPEELPDHLEHARLLVRQKILVLTDLDGSRAFIFGLSSAMGDEELDEIRAELAQSAVPEGRISVYTGFGLGQHSKPLPSLGSRD